MRIEISREEILLDTGGGLKKVARFFLDGQALDGQSDEPFLLHNVDVISNIDFQAMFERHVESGALATLAVQERSSSRQLLFDNDSLLCGRKSDDAAPEIARAAPPYCSLAFCGIHVISSRIFPLLTEAGVFPIIPAYLRLAGQGEKILGFRADEYDWKRFGYAGESDSRRGLKQDFERRHSSAIGVFSPAPFSGPHRYKIKRRATDSLPSAKQVTLD